MDIVIISQYLRNITNFDVNNSRFVYLAKLLAQSGENVVEIVTSDFNHVTKSHFEQAGELSKVRISTIHEAGYHKNVSFKRFLSHKELAKNIENYLNERKKPDVCYCAVPSLDVGYAVAQYCNRNGVRFVVDIQDLWPEAFKMVFHVPIMSDLIFAPMRKKADSIYKSADHVVAVSRTYAERAKKVNTKCSRPSVVYLGTEKESFDKYAQKAIKKDEGVTIGYIGSMSDSYDLKSVIDAIGKIDASTTIKLLAMGDGPLKTAFVEHAEERGINAEFTGALPYPQMVVRLQQCDIAVNPISKGSAGSIINKVGDYAMAGLPVINTQECQEYRDLLDEYHAGINCECENVDEIADALMKLISNSTLRMEMSYNSRRVGEERFDRRNIYSKLVNDLLTKTGGN